MMCGWGSNKGFISLYAITYFMVFTAIVGIQMMILENRLLFYQNMESLEQKTYIEILVMQRIKDSYETEKNEDCTLYYEDYQIVMQYKEEMVTVIYDNYVDHYQKQYRYHIDEKYLEIVGE